MTLIALEVLHLDTLLGDEANAFVYPPGTFLIRARIEPPPSEPFDQTCTIVLPTGERLTGLHCTESERHGNRWTVSLTRSKRPA